MADNDTSAERVTSAPAGTAGDRAARSPRQTPAEDTSMSPPLPPLSGFQTPGDAHRLRDLLAFAMAVEAGRPIAPNAIDGLRRDADAALEGYAFRSLHNRVEEIRLAAVQEHIGRLRAPPGFLTLVVANITALVLLAGGAVLAWRYHGPALLAWLGA